ncbi:hypothetical protein OSB04_007124 [Centaurea solstitialis]|uniref:Uncharacterized protein n=1 Tax=Centaurea solstitialis TaxID=347529 RepID=A0AA38WSE6_9ASTR|nr:hypothetical protein OSB04_007124 [Centaurea solstitialis]
MRHLFRRERNQFRANQVEKNRFTTVTNRGGNMGTSVPHRSRHYRNPIGFGVPHNWVKRSIFWELPYWHTLLIRHNLDVMYTKKNVFENLFHTIMDTPKSKDNIKARRDIEEYCNRLKLHIKEQQNKIFKPRTSYTLNKEQVRKVYDWLNKLKFPDGYASNIGA